MAAHYNAVSRGQDGPYTGQKYLDLFVKAFGYEIGIDPSPAPWQRGFWMDKIGKNAVNIGLGLVILILRLQDRP